MIKGSPLRAFSAPLCGHLSSTRHVRTISRVSTTYSVERTGQGAAGFWRSRGPDGSNFITSYGHKEAQEAQKVVWLLMEMSPRTLGGDRPKEQGPTQACHGSSHCRYSQTPRIYHRHVERKGFRRHARGCSGRLVGSFMPQPEGSVEWMDTRQCNRSLLLRAPPSSMTCFARSGVITGALSSVFPLCLVRRCPTP